jgi:hypothetical protein
MAEPHQAYLGKKHFHFRVFSVVVAAAGSNFSTAAVSDVSGA